MKKFFVMFAVLLFFGTNSFAANGDLIVNGQFNQLPAGTIMMYGGIVQEPAPPGCETILPGRWLLANGCAVSRTTYSSLFAAIGETYGAGDHSNTFNLPDFRRRVAVGAGGTGSPDLGNAVGSSGGEEKHTLTIPEMPKHAHTITSYDEQDPGPCNSAGVNCAGGLNYPSTNISGLDEGHNNMQPSLVVNYIIKY